MPKVGSSTFASFLPNVHITPEQTPYLKIGGIVVMSLAAGAYLSGRIGAKTAFTAECLGGGLLVAGFWGGEESKKESLIVSQFVRPALAAATHETSRGGVHSEKLLLACAYHLPPNEARELIRKTRHLGIYTNSNGRERIRDVSIAMESILLQYLIEDTIPNLDTFKAEFCKPDTFECSLIVERNKLIRFVCLMPAETIYQWLMDELQKNIGEDALDRSALWHKICLFKVLISALSNSADMDRVMDNYGELCTAAAHLFSSRFKGQTSYISEDFEPFSMLISCLADLPDEHFENALDLLLQTEAFQDPNKWPSTDEVALVVARAPREKLFNKLNKMLIDTNPGVIALEAYAKMAKPDHATYEQLKKLLGEYEPEADILMSLSKLDPSLYRPLISSLLENPTPFSGLVEPDHAINAMLLILWERGHTCEDDISTDHFPKELKNSDGELLPVLQILERYAKIESDDARSLHDLLQEKELQSRLEWNSPLLRFLFDWICDSTGYTEANHAKLLAIFIAITKEADKDKNVQFLCLEIARRMPSKKFEMAEAMLESYVCGPLDFLWKHDPTLALEYYLRPSLEHWETKKAMKHLPTFYPFASEEDNELAMQLLTNLFNHKETDFLLKADILNLLAPVALADDRSSGQKNP